MMLRRSFLQLCAALLPAAFKMDKQPDVIVSASNGDRGMVYDATGRRVQQCIEANLTTGRCVVFVTNSDGQVVLNKKGDDIEMQIVHRPAVERHTVAGMIV